MSDDKLDQILSKLEAQSAAIAALTERVDGIEGAQSRNLAAITAGFEGVNDRLDNMQSELGLVRDEVRLARTEIGQFRKEYSGGYRALNHNVTKIAERVGALEKA